MLCAIIPASLLSSEASGLVLSRLLILFLASLSIDEKSIFFPLSLIFSLPFPIILHHNFLYCNINLQKGIKIADGEEPSAFVCLIEINPRQARGHDFHSYFCYVVFKVLQGGKRAEISASRIFSIVFGFFVFMDILNHPLLYDILFSTERIKFVWSDER